MNKTIINFIPKECNTLFFTICSFDSYNLKNDSENYQIETIQNEEKIYIKEYEGLYLLILEYKGWFYSISSYDYKEAVEILESIF